jgi:hypothetical protein
MEILRRVCIWPSGLDLAARTSVRLLWPKRALAQTAKPRSLDDEAPRISGATESGAFLI